jgi:hypothetical protein
MKIAALHIVSAPDLATNLATTERLIDQAAADAGKGERNNSFTRNLLKAIQQPGQPIEEVFKEVRRNVTGETNGAQVPWESTSLTGFFSLRQTR